jgi:hypothetical protein
MLSDQEVRNCLLVMINPDFFRWLNELAKTPDFRDAIALTDRALSEQYDVEIALRFLVFRRMAEGELNRIGDVGEFLTDRMMELATSNTYNRVEEQRIFDSLFSAINQSVGSDAFRRWVPQENRFKGGFSVSAFEAVAIGMGHWMPRTVAPTEILPRVKAVWANQEFIDNSGSGVRASTRIPKTVLVGRATFLP